MNLYNRHIWLYHFVFFTLFGYSHAIKAFLLIFFQGRTGITNILDACTGSGLLIQSLYSIKTKAEIERYHLYGIDISQKMLERFDEWIRQKQLTNITIVQSNILDIDHNLPMKEKFDLILSSGMMEYLDKKDFVPALRLLASRMADSG